MTAAQGRCRREPVYGQFAAGADRRGAADLPQWRYRRGADGPRRRYGRGVRCGTRCRRGAPTDRPAGTLRTDPRRACATTPGGPPCGPRGGSGCAAARMHHPSIFGQSPFPTVQLTPSGVVSTSETTGRGPACATAREAGFAPRTGPSPAGNEVTVSPSPLDPVQRADPRRSHGSAPDGGRPARTDRRTGTRTRSTCQFPHPCLNMNPAIRDTGS